MELGAGVGALYDEPAVRNMAARRSAAVPYSLLHSGIDMNVGLAHDPFSVIAALVFASTYVHVQTAARLEIALQFTLLI